MIVAALLQASWLVGGVCVESVEKGTPADQAGLRAGDVLVSWSRASEREGVPAGGPLASPFDLTRVELEVVPRVPVILSGLRDGQPLTVRVDAGEWVLRARPMLPAFEEEAYRRGEADWPVILDRLGARDEWTLACWLALRIAERSPSDDAAAAAGDACALSGRAELLAAAHRARAMRWQRQRRPREAEAAFREALVLAAPGSLAQAAALNDLGELFWAEGRLKEAKEQHQAALRLREALAPESLELAASLHAAGRMALALTEPEAAPLTLRALALRQRLVPNGLSTARTLGNMSVVLRLEGDLAQAADMLERSLAIASAVDPVSPAVDVTLTNLGTLATLRGDSAGAEAYYEKSLALAEKRDPGGYQVGTNLINLGGVATLRGDLDAAESFYRRALALYERISPQSLGTAGALEHMGHLLIRQGKLDEADTLLRRSLALTEALAPHSHSAAGALVSLAELALTRSDQATLEELGRRAEAFIAQFAPQDHTVASLQRLLGEVAARRGDVAAAERRYERAIEIETRSAPPGVRLAQLYHGLGELRHRAGRGADAAGAHRSAVEALEAEARGLSGGGRSRIGFGIRHARIYQACIEALLDGGQTEEAFHYWERSRARALLEMLAERDLALDAELPAPLRGRRRAVDAQYERTQGSLAGAADPAEQEKLLERLRELRIEQQGLIEQARQASPRLANVVYPQPLRLDQARQALDSGTLLLAFAVGSETSRVFVLEGPGGPEPALSTYTLPAGEQALRERVSRFRALVAETAPASGQHLADEARALYALLLGPADARLGRAQRLLISPDGPLHALPFAALRRGPQYLVQWKPVHLAASITLYAQLRQAAEASRRARRPLVAFGDPHYGDLERAAAQLDDPELRRAAKRDAGLSPLPGTRDEVRSIARLFPGATAYTGQQATEEQAKAVGDDVRYVHFASHALLDERFPLNSALALSTPEGSGGGRDNGLLQAWEVIEQVRLRADLVTLSACDSALGGEAAGEGLLGLAWAFHYAGARSVLASLWAVTDGSTAVLMKRFYAELRAGRSLDEGLRRAQLSLLSHGRYQHPRHWAAFQLSGDWR
jgi:CHAT domain-containing protein/Tfp pilus assembly protein PilF